MSDAAGKSTAGTEPTAADASAASAAPPDVLPARARMRDGRRDLDRTVSAIVRVWDRRDLVEEMLAQQKPESEITRSLMNDGLSKQQAHRYQAAVRLRWRKNGALEGREGRLARYRAGLERQAVLADKEGDRKAAIAALGLLIKHEGEAPQMPPPGAGNAALPADAVPSVVDRHDLNEELRRRRATQAGGT